MNPVRVYISSTSRDLGGYRAAAAKAVSELDFRGVAMESSVASPKQPLAKCLEDVRSCQIYLGIVAWRYGFVPAPEHGGDGTASITEFEYREAGKAGIPRLLFLAEPEGDWPHRDRDPTAVEGFRGRIAAELMVASFHSTDSLAYKVAVALGRHLQTAARPGDAIEIDPLLPYLSDRSEQSYQLQEAFGRHRERARRPLIAVVHGDENEAHGEFVERLRRVTLPRLLDLDGETEPVHHCRVEWSEPRDSLEDRSDRLRRRLAERLTGSREAGAADLVAEISRKRSPVVISTQIVSDDWQPHELELIQRWLASWTELPDLPPGQLLLVVLSVVYQLPSRRRGESRIGYALRARAVGSRRRRAESGIGRLAETPPEGLTLVVLKRLAGLRKHHIFEWIEEHAGRFCRQARGAIRDPILLRERLAPWVDSFFRDFEHPDEFGGIPMGVLAPELRRRLQACLTGGIR